MFVLDAKSATSKVEIEPVIAYPVDLSACGLAADAVDASAVKADAAAKIATAVWAKTGLTAGGTVTAGAMLKNLLAMAKGKVVASGNDLAVYDDDGSTLLFTITLASGGRTVA